MVLIGISLLLIALALWAEILMRSREAKRDRTEAARSEAPMREAEKTPEPEPQSFDEGFANIMQFSVCGKTGFESEGE